MKTKIYVYAENKRYATDAQNLANHLQTEVIQSPADADKEALILNFTQKGLTLSYKSLSLFADFTTMLPRVKEQMWKHEMLVKAAKFKDPEGKLTAVDATAGLGEDSLLLAASGFHVTMYEYDPVIAALLKDCLRRARKIPELKEMASRMQVVEGDSILAMNKMIDQVDIIYLDPMFPERQKSSLIKKKFQLIQKLESPCTDGDQLLAAAMKAKPKRIIIKRPAKGPYVANVKPSYSIEGKSIRYDCIVT